MADLKVMVASASLHEARGPLLALPIAEGDDATHGALAAIDGANGGVLRRALSGGDFRGSRDEAFVVYPQDLSSHVDRLVLVGLGKRDEVDAECLRRAVGTALRQAERIHVASVGFLAEQAAEAVGLSLGGTAHVLAEASVLAAWDFRELKTVPDPDRTDVESVTVFAESGSIIEVRRAAGRGEVTGRAANFARGLAIRPGNVATPTYLAEAANALANRFGLKATILDRDAMRQEGMGALLAVAAGSEEEPRFIVLEYQGANAADAPLALIGKGVTFDAGGISIKPADRMEEMKYDMSGAAGTLGAMQGIAELGLRINVVALVPATENLPSGRAVKPGDIIGSHLGKSIEVINTDAEGRLILADALSYARRFNPAAMLDAATLTGAIVVGLGHNAIGLMGNHDGLVEEVRSAGETAGERCWPLPLWPEYRRQLDSPVADLKNTGGRAAGSITAGWFLREFAGDTPWAHLDIAGTAYRDEPATYLRKGPTGVPTRLLIEWVRTRSAE